MRNYIHSASCSVSTKLRSLFSLKILSFSIFFCEKRYTLSNHLDGDMTTNIFIQRGYTLYGLHQFHMCEIDHFKIHSTNAHRLESSYPSCWLDINPKQSTCYVISKQELPWSNMTHNIPDKIRVHDYTVKDNYSGKDNYIYQTIQPVFVIQIQVRIDMKNMITTTLSCIFNQRAR